MPLVIILLVIDFAFLYQKQKNIWLFPFSTTLWLLLRWLFLTFNLNKTPLGETGCLSKPYFLITACLGIQFFDSPLSQTQSVRLPLAAYPSLRSHCVTYRTYVIPLVTKYFPPSRYLGKQRMPLGVASILSMCLCSHT